MICIASRMKYNFDAVFHDCARLGYISRDQPFALVADIQYSTDTPNYVCTKFHNKKGLCSNEATSCSRLFS